MTVSIEKTKSNIPLSGDSHHFVSRPGSRKLLILMSATGTKPGHFNLWKMRDMIPHNQLYLRTPQNDWYQDGIAGLGADFETTIESIQQIIKAKGCDEIYACGSSMGGYGALLFGVALDATVLAFSAEIHLKLPFSRSIKMMPKETTVRFPNLVKMMAKSKKNIHLYLGEFDPVDLYCSSLVRKLPKVSIATFPHDEHTVMRTMAFEDTLLPTILALLENDPLPAPLHNGHALDKSDYADAFFKGWRQLMRDKPSEARGFFETALKFYPSSSRGNYFLAKTHHKQGDFFSALKYAALAASLAPTVEEHQIFFAHCLRKCGFLEEALAAHRRIQGTWPDAARSYFDAGQVWATKQMHKKAYANFTQAVRVDPGNASFLKLQKRALSRIGQSAP